jgi:hypothetical protein
MIITVLVGHPDEYRYFPAWNEEGWEGPGSAWSYYAEACEAEPLDEGGRPLPIQLLLVDFNGWAKDLHGVGKPEDPEDWNLDWCTLAEKNI